MNFQLGGGEGGGFAVGPRLRVASIAQSSLLQQQLVKAFAHASFIMRVYTKLLHIHMVVKAFTLEARFGKSAHFTRIVKRNLFQLLLNSFLHDLHTLFYHNTKLLSRKGCFGLLAKMQLLSFKLKLIFVDIRWLHIELSTPKFSLADPPALFFTSGISTIFPS